VVTKKVKSWEIKVIHAVDMYTACPLRVVNSPVLPGSQAHTGCPVMVVDP